MSAEQPPNVADSRPLAPAERLRARLNSGGFLWTAELESPRNASSTNVRRQARAYRPYVDAIDCTDNSAAIVRMSPVAAAALAAEEAPNVLVQLTCRDRNRLALESEILGAAAVGAAGVVCIGGDPPRSGNHPQAKGVYDLSSVELIALVQGLNQRRSPAGASSGPVSHLVIGCVENPADGRESVRRLIAKSAAGAEFVQTQITFDVEVLAHWMELLRAESLHERLRLLVGVAPVRTLRSLRFLQDHVSGVSVPESIVRRMERAQDPEAEGIAIAADLVRAVRRIQSVTGVHLMTFGWSEGVRRVVEASS